MNHDIVGVGEAMIRLWVPAGRRLEDAPAFEATVAGAEANVMMAASRFGARTAFLSALPDNPLGRRAAREIAAHGVDVDHLEWMPEARMGTYFVELGVPPRPTRVLYDRAGSAASRMDAGSIAWPVVEGASILHVTGITPALSTGCRDLTFELVERARASSTFVSFDLNYRQKLWTARECADTVRAVARSIDLLVVTAEDARHVLGRDGDPVDVAEAVATDLGVERAIVTAGSSGAAWVDGSGSGSAPAHGGAVSVDRIGAGDAFAAGVLLGVLDGDLPGGVERGLAMAALKLGVFGDQLTIDPGDVDRLLGDSGREVER